MSDYKALFRHSRNYLFANLATKALAFISIPVYTRILTVEEYGIVGVFMSIVGIATVLFTLNSDVSISRYYYDAKDINDFKSFVGSNLIITVIVLCVTSSIFFLFLPYISEKLSFPQSLTVCLLPVALYSVINRIFDQIYNPMMQSRKIAIVSSVQAYLAFALSVICMLMLSREKYYGYIYGNILAMFILAIYLYRQIRPYCILAFKKEYNKYIINYCVPYIPYTLSGVILSQFSRIFMGNNQGYTLAGSYTLTTNIAALMLLVIGITHSAWNPYYFRYMNDHDTKSIDNDYNIIWRLTLLAAFALSAFGSEIALLLSKGGDFLVTIHVLPLLCLGFVFYQWSYVYLRNAGYTKRNIWNAYCVIGSGVVNIFLNSYLVPLYAEVGAAFSTLMSYLMLLLFSYCANHFVLKEYVPEFKLFMLPFVLILPLFAALWLVYNLHYNFWIALFVKFALLIIGCILMLYRYRKSILNFLNTLHNG